MKKIIAVILAGLLAFSLAGMAEENGERLLCIPLPEEAVIFSQDGGGVSFQLRTSTWRSAAYGHDENKPLEAHIDEAYEKHSELVNCKTVALEDGKVECYRFTHTFNGDEYPIYCAWYSDDVHDYLVLIDIGQWTSEEIEAQLEELALVAPGELTADE